MPLVEAVGGINYCNARIPSVTTPSFKTRVLLISPDCHPNVGGSACNSYCLASELSRREELSITLVTDVRHQKDLRQTDLADQARLVFVNGSASDDGWIGWLEQQCQRRWFPRLLADSVRYQLFEQAIATQLQPEIAGGQFDLIHRFSPHSPLIPSPLARKTEVPFVLGPLTDAPVWPKEFSQLQREASDRWRLLRSLVRSLIRWQPAYRATYRQAHAVICANQHTAAYLPRRYRGQLFRIPEHGLDPGMFTGDRAWNLPKARRFRFITSGTITRGSGLELLLEALQGLPSLRRVELVIIGDGPHRNPIQQLVTRLDLESRVKLAGPLEPINLMDELMSAHVYVAPHLCSGEAGPILDAMACGLPSIVVGYGTPGELVPDRCGVVIQMQRAETLVGALRTAMESLVNDPRLCRDLSISSMDHVFRTYSWPVLAAKISQIYHHVLEPEVMASTAERQLVAFAAGR
jgi:glycosyltransferase involved in cell wall biosynthesis